MQVFRITERGMAGMIGPVRSHTVFLVLPSTSYGPPPISTCPSDGAILPKRGNLSRRVCKAKPWPFASHRGIAANKRPGRWCSAASAGWGSRITTPLGNVESSVDPNGIHVLNHKLEDTNIRSAHY